MTNRGEDLTDIKVEDEEERMMGDPPCKSEVEEDIPGDVTTDGSRRRNPPKRCPRPLYSQDCPEEKVPENPQKIPARILWEIAWYQRIIKQKMKKSCSTLQEKTLMCFQDFTVQIYHIIPLIMRNLLLAGHKLLPQVQVRKGFSVGNRSEKAQVFLQTEEFTQERNHIHVQNVGNALQKNYILLHMREVTQERSHICVQNVGNVLELNHILVSIREFTPEQNHIYVQNVGNLL
ncbi:uncharacterized protein LOC122925142 [Bufo gargarizans]|uniref:uncharacterized protein LOC122925142 n=1 Tax=Bufo gargarizans TaxID=30331 RepID=UPI001CF55618|nr:uncharacterized protein LOC122925142 [Bufo gargarizans]